MAWLEIKRKRDGSATYWIRDRRGGIQIVIPGGNTLEEAQDRLDKYVIRHDLEKEGYEDKLQAVLDALWGPKGNTSRKPGDN